MNKEISNYILNSKEYLDVLLKHEDAIVATSLAARLQ
jgi:hypothetical protein